MRFKSVLKNTCHEKKYIAREEKLTWMKLHKENLNLRCLSAARMETQEKILVKFLILKFLLMFQNFRALCVCVCVCVCGWVVVGCA